MSEPTPDDIHAADLARLARSELEATEDAFDTIRAEALEALATSALGESLLREKLYLSVQAIDAVRDRLRQHVANGVMAEHNKSMRQLLGEIEADDAD